jgi:hypothetical protein
MVEPAKLLRWYEAGRVTRHELLLRLLQAAAEREPAEIAADLPTDLLAEVRERAAVPPATPDGCRVIGSVCAGPGFDAEAHFREESRRLYDGLWRWHGYFADV